MTFTINKIFEQKKLGEQVADFLESANKQPQPDYKNIAITVFKAEAEKRFNEILKSKKKDKVEKIVNLSIDGSSGNIPVRIYTPTGNGPFPVFYYIHGGGWMTGSLDSHDNICRAICKRSECIVVAVEYRLSPENKFPCGLNDVSTVFEWIINNIQLYDGINTGIGIGGDSGGGNLSAALTIKYKESAKYKIHFQILVYPSLNISSFDTNSFEKFKEGYVLTKEKVEWYAEKYLANDKDKFNVLASPLLNQDMKGLPPAYIATAEYDVLRDEGEEYARKLYEAGVPVKCIRYGGLIHAFLNMDGILSKVDSVFTDISEIVKTYFQKYL